MSDREKILKAAKYCLTSDPMHCPDECPYYENYKKTGQLCGFDPLLTDIIAYLEEQESMKPTFHINGRFGCGQCGRLVYREDSYCSHCGRKIKWEDIKT